MSLTESEIAELTRNYEQLQNDYTIAVNALIRLAAFDDETANRTLRNYKSYSLFDEPGAVQLSRETLKLINEGPESNV